MRVGPLELYIGGLSHCHNAGIGCLYTLFMVHVY